MSECGLENLNMAIIQDPTNKSLHKKYIEMKKELAKEQINQVKEKLFKDKAKAISCGIKPTKAFFTKYRKNIRQDYIKCLKNSEGIAQHEMPQIINIVEKHYEKTFQENEINYNVAQLFLNEVKTIDDFKDNFNNDELTKPISKEEFEDILCQTPNNKSPEPDGLSYEFYKNICRDKFIKGKFIEVLNKMLDTAKNQGKFSSKIVAGLIKLIPKRPPYDEIKNYRLISLINTDLKILTRILSSRLVPYVSKILHPTQYAQPGKDINVLNTQIRDLYYEMSNSKTDSFLVSIDFESAFDKINHKFLMIVLEKIGFPPMFINVIKALYNNASSVVYINGHKTKRIKIKSGIRQGCTLSRDLFTIAINPLLCLLNSMTTIQKYVTWSNAKILTNCFTDDLNVVTASLSSLITCLFYINK